MWQTVLVIAVAIVFAALCFPTSRDKTSVTERWMYRRYAEQQQNRADSIIRECEARDLNWPPNAVEAFRKQLPWSFVFSRYDIVVFVMMMATAVSYFLFLDSRITDDTRSDSVNEITDVLNTLLAMLFATAIRRLTTFSTGKRTTPGTTVDAVAGVLEEAMRDRTYEFRQSPSQIRGSLAYLSRSLRSQRFRARLRFIGPNIRKWSSLTEAGENDGKIAIARNAIRFYALFIDGQVDSIISEFGETPLKRVRIWRKAQKPIETILFACLIAAFAVIAHKQGVPDLILVVPVGILTWAWAERLNIPLSDIVTKLKP